MKFFKTLLLVTLTVIIGPSIAEWAATNKAQFIGCVFVLIFLLVAVSISKSNRKSRP